MRIMAISKPIILLKKTISSKKNFLPFVSTKHIGSPDETIKFREHKKNIFFPKLRFLLIKLSLISKKETGDYLGKNALTIFRK